MMIVLKTGTTLEAAAPATQALAAAGIEFRTLFGGIGSAIYILRQLPGRLAEELRRLPCVVGILPASSPWPFASRTWTEKNTVVRVGSVSIGGSEVVVIAGPCAVETEKQFLETAIAVKASGAKMLRGGAFKPRTSPYAFQGLGEPGLKIMAKARELTGLPLVSEVLDPRDVELMANYVDVLQIGTRNMQNFRLLLEVGKSGKPVLLKRGFTATIEEWLQAAEYILSQGNPNVILCERGIRTAAASSTRNTLDVSAIPVVQRLSHLPVVVDPSHASGHSEYVPALSLAAVAAGADGLIVEVHQDPSRAWSDGDESLSPSEFDAMMCKLAPLAAAVNRHIG